MSQAQLNELGKLIHRERVKAKLTQRDLAEKAGMGYATICHLERGDFKHPDPDKLQRIARLLDLAVGDLFALVGYIPSDVLPNFGPWLQGKFPGEFSQKDRKHLERYFERYRREHGRRGVSARTKKGG
jgi:transcriptional regulator with XRE-family HTH domain